jgi:hypothetical protein
MLPRVCLRRPCGRLVRLQGMRQTVELMESGVKRPGRRWRSAARARTNANERAAAAMSAIRDRRPRGNLSDTPNLSTRSRVNMQGS